MSTTSIATMSAKNISCEQVTIVGGTGESIAPPRHLIFAIVFPPPKAVVRYSYYSIVA